LRDQYRVLFIAFKQSIPMNGAKIVPRIDCVVWDHRIVYNKPTRGSNYRLVALSALYENLSWRLGAWRKAPIV
jgi:hypothetical protein